MQAATRIPHLASNVDRSGNWAEWLACVHHTQQNQVPAPFFRAGAGSLTPENKSRFQAIQGYCPSAVCGGAVRLRGVAPSTPTRKRGGVFGYSRMT